MFTPPKPRTDLRWVSVDFDNTLCTTVGPNYDMGDPIARNVREVAILRGAGFKIVIYTARPWSDYEAVEAWLAHHEIAVDRIECGKLLTIAHFDDRAYNAAREDWLAAVSEQQDAHTPTPKCDALISEMSGPNYPYDALRDRWTSAFAPHVVVDTTRNHDLLMQLRSAGRCECCFTVHPLGAVRFCTACCVVSGGDCCDTWENSFRSRAGA